MKFRSILRVAGNTIRMAGNTITGRLKKGLVFIHIPKCGGTSITSAIGACCQRASFSSGPNVINLNSRTSSDVIKLFENTNYPYDTNDDFPILDFRTKMLGYYMGFRDVDFISGHFPFNERLFAEFGGRFSFVTILRDPSQRWISSYFFNRFKSGTHRKIEDDIERYLESDFGRSQGYEMVKFLGGAKQNADYTSLESIERAKHSLHRFDLVGLIENLTAFKKGFKRLTGKTINVQQKNPSPVNSELKYKILNDKIIEKIEKICAPDQEVYRYAKSFIHLL